MDSFAAREFYTVVVGGCILSHIAGYINAVSLSGAYTLPVSHLTGTVTKVGIALLRGELRDFLVFGGLVLAFMTGSFTSGYMLGNSKFQLGRGYGVALIIEAGALFLSYLLLNWDMVLGEIAAAYACGLQNAMVSSYSGAVLRTTHMTGLCTDVGIVCGQALSRRGKAELWKLKVLLPLLFGYTTGGMTGWLSFLAIGTSSLLIPSFLLLAAAVFYLTWEPAREARLLLTTAVTKVQTEIEMGIRAIATPLVDLSKNIHLPHIGGSNYDLASQTVVKSASTKDPLTQTHHNEAIDKEIDQLFRDMEIQRRLDTSKQSTTEPLRANALVGAERARSSTSNDNNNKEVTRGSGGGMDPSENRSELQDGNLDNGDEDDRRPILQVSQADMDSKPI